MDSRRISLSSRRDCTGRTTKENRVTMKKRFVCIWFLSLKTEWYMVRYPGLKQVPFAVTAPGHGSMILTAANRQAIAAGAVAGMALTDARSMIPSLQVI